MLWVYYRFSCDKNILRIKVMASYRSFSLYLQKILNFTILKDIGLDPAALPTIYVLFLQWVSGKG